MSKSKFVTQETTKTVTDVLGRTIEITQSKTIKTNANTEPFFMVYCQQLAPLYNLTSASAIKILYKFMEKATFNEGIINLTSAFREEIIKTLDISPSSFIKCLNTLIDSELVLETYNKEVNYDTGEEVLTKRKGEYVINPAILWKGEHSKRQQLLKAGCTITFTPTFEEETAE